jgi:tetrahydromethanopterin S-methyltransferase subunit A
VERNLINVEHYAYDNTLLHIIEGPNARSLYLAIIDHGWITELSHAAYLGKELARAELSTQGGFKYVQDGA